MDAITICDLEVRYHVGITAAERAQAQRLLITVVMERDLKPAANTDDLLDTIDYFAVSQAILAFGNDCQWELIETVAGDIAQMILDDFKPQRVTVEVKKFIIPQTRHVSVRLSRERPKI